MKKLVWMTVVCAGFLLAGCSEDEKLGGVGEPCPCKPELTCQGSVCVDLPCGGACNPQTEACVEGQCVPVGDANDKDGDLSPVAEDCDDFNPQIHPGAIEVCDGVDNNCDSQTDEDCPACRDLDTKPCGTDMGECTQGVQECQQGRWQACSGGGPAPEICDGKDNDCDGLADEICPCQEGDERPCSSNQGTCVAGFQACESGEWSGCKNGQLPVEETCDGADNDCDGLTDEGFVQICGCQDNLQCPLTQACVSGVCVQEEFRSFGAGAAVYTTPNHRVQLFVGPTAPVGDASGAFHVIQLGPGAVRAAQ